MKQPVDNYKIQAAQAKKLFLSYDQQELIHRCRLRFDETYLYTALVTDAYRIHRQTGDMERLQGSQWVDGNSFAEVMTVLDWLCDSKPGRCITGRWVNLVNQGPYFHRNLQEDGPDANAMLFCQNPERFQKACEELGGERLLQGDISYAIPLLDDLRILVQLWFGDDEFPARLRCLWDENALQYLRYETSWYAIGLLLKRIRENME